MIRFVGVAKCYGEGEAAVRALRGVDLNVPSGQMCAVMGPSGSGKSTLLHAASGLASVDSGAIIIGDNEVTTLSRGDLALMRRRQVGIVSQFSDLIPFLTSYENVALPLVLDSVGDSDERVRVTRALELAGIEHRAGHKPHQLSGGEMQRVAIARAIVIRPQVILADEPTGNLDTRAGESIMGLFRHVNEATGVTMMIVTHDPVWASLCDRVVRLEDGRIGQDIALPDADEPAPEARLLH